MYFEKDDHELTKRRGEPGTELEENIALFQQQVFKEWGNNNDNSVTYHHPTGVDIPCTPLMIRDWAIAIVCLHVIFRCLGYTSNTLMGFKAREKGHSYASSQHPVL